MSVLNTTEPITVVTNRVCRICLIPNGEFSDIYVFSAAIMECAPVNISPGDGLPSLICETCLNRLQAAQQFRVLCIQSDVTLRRNGGQIKTSYPTSNSPAENDNTFVEFENNDEKYDLISDREDNDLDNFLKSAAASEEIEDIKPPIEVTTPATTKKLVNYRPSNAKKSFICNFCYKSFARAYDLIIHKRIHTGSKPYICNFCMKKFGKEGDLKKHQRRMHMGERPHKCGVCSKSFLKLCQVLVHMRKHTGEKPFVCDVCKKKFIHKFSLKTHMYSHTGLYPYVCDVCSKGFNHTYALNLHMRIHTGEKPFGCDMCSKRFATIHNLATHKRVHSGVKPFKCDICNKRFSQKPNLTTHLRVHTGEKPFSCQICLKDFTSRAILTQHMRTHTGEKPYTCNQCQKSFNDRGSYRKHTRNHSGERPYSCDICTKKFTSSNNLTKHKKIHQKQQELQEQKDSTTNALIETPTPVAPVTVPAQEVQTQVPVQVSLPVQLIQTSAVVAQVQVLSQNFFTCEVCYMKFADNNSLVKHKYCHRDYFKY